MLHPGSKTRRSPTIRTLALKTGVSVATISRYFTDAALVSDEVGTRIRQAAERLGYQRRPVGRRRDRTRKCLGLLVSKRMRPDVVADPVLEEIRDRLGLLAERAGYELVVLESHAGADATQSEALFRKRLLFEGPLGVFLYGDWNPAGIPAYCRSRLLPVVRLNRSGGADLGVGIDQEALGYLATRHLLELGHPRVALLMPSDAAEVGSARRSGWLRAHREFSALPGPEWALPTAGIRQGYEALGRLIGPNFPESALFCNNDATALGAMRALHEAGLSVPGEVSVVGCDDLELAAHAIPSLTTVKQDFAGLCQGALDLMRSALAARDGAPVSLALPPVLIRRESSGAP